MFKKLILVMAALVIFSSSALAAWTAVETRRKYKNGNVVISILFTSDAAAGAYDLTTYLSDVIGLYLYSVSIVPGAGGVAPDNTFDLDIEDHDDYHILDTDGNSNTAESWHLGSDTLGQFPMIKSTLSFVIADIGAAADQITVELYFAGQ